MNISGCDIDVGTYANKETVVPKIELISSNSYSICHLDWSQYYPLPFGLAFAIVIDKLQDQMLAKFTLDVRREVFSQNQLSVDF